MTNTKKEGLALLREPFPAHQISKLPKPTCKMEEWRQLPKATCKECGAYHATTKTIHLDYVGHAALTDRLLDADDAWSWEPLSFTEEGLPRFDESGGLWIRLKVCGISRLGYGHAKQNPFADPGAREKEVIGDALRNAAMRFGAALDLWHKGDLHVDEDEQEAQSAEDTDQKPTPQQPARQEPAPRADNAGPACTAGQARILRSMLERKGMGEAALAEAFSVESLEALPAARVNDAIAWVQAQEAQS